MCLCKSAAASAPNQTLQQTAAAMLVFRSLLSLSAAAAAELMRSGATRSRRRYCNALNGVTLPAVLPAVSYRDVRHGEPWGAKLPGQRSLLLHGRRPRSRGQGRDSQHPGGWEPGWCGRVNTREAPLNVVTKAKGQMLNRLDQKVRGQVRRLRTPPAQPTHHRRRGAT